MCKEILDAEEPFYWNCDLSEREKEGSMTDLEHVEEKMFFGYNKITNKEVILFNPFTVIKKSLRRSF
ncbi:hypothetical protein CWR45_16065 [Oceanobacillus chungangensis]|uniref:Uncharacterized protein n=1 Tax=Oceanobacillus chungangensis TaxID=1229152 RepID=A0A3D8PL03_9BACI|nr:hypothetical protein CWR45_16065 [Oceanobacillus chungangensis]